MTIQEDVGCLRTREVSVVIVRYATHARSPLREYQQRKLGSRFELPYREKNAYNGPDVFIADVERSRNTTVKGKAPVLIAPVTSYAAQALRANYGHSQRGADLVFRRIIPCARASSTIRPRGSIYVEVSSYKEVSHPRARAKKTHTLNVGLTEPCCVSG